MPKVSPNNRNAHRLHQYLPQATDMTRCALCSCALSDGVNVQICFRKITSRPYAPLLLQMRYIQADEEALPLQQHSVDGERRANVSVQPNVCLAETCPWH